MKKILLVAIMALAMCPTMLAASVAMPGDDATDSVTENMTPDQQLRFFVDAMNSLIVNGGLGSDNPLTSLEIDDEHNAVVLFMQVDDAETVKMMDEYSDMFKSMLLKEFLDGDDMTEFFQLIIATDRDFDIFMSVPGDADTNALITFTPAELQEALKK